MDIISMPLQLSTLKDICYLLDHYYFVKLFFKAFANDCAEDRISHFDIIYKSGYRGYQSNFQIIDIGDDEYRYETRILVAHYW